MNVKQKKIEMKITEQNKGITLIALVITVIVILILAGVTIATLTGDNRIVTKSTKFKGKINRCRNRGRDKISME